MLFMTKKCYDKIDKKEYNRLLARVRRKPCCEAISSSSTVTPHKRTKTELSYAFFVERDSRENLCGAGGFHSGSSINN